MGMPRAARGGRRRYGDSSGFRQGLTDRGLT